MATDAQLVAYLEGLVPTRIPYCVNARFGPDCDDCSGIAHRAFGAIGVDDGGAAGWTSRTFEDWGTAAHVKVDLATAKQTPGAMLFEGHSDGPLGHMAIVRDASTVFETPCKDGHWFGVSPNDYNSFTSATLVPGLIYTGHLPTLQSGGTALPGAGTVGGLGDLAGCLPVAVVLAGGAAFSLFELARHIL